LPLVTLISVLAWTATPREFCCYGALWDQVERIATDAERGSEIASVSLNGLSMNVHVARIAAKNTRRMKRRNTLVCRAVAGTISRLSARSFLFLAQSHHNDCNNPAAVCSRDSEYRNIAARGSLLCYLRRVRGDQR
jgi:hypothetical protein